MVWREVGEDGPASLGLDSDRSSSFSMFAAAVMAHIRAINLNHDDMKNDETGLKHCGRKIQHLHLERGFSCRGSDVGHTVDGMPKTSNDGLHKWPADNRRTPDKRKMHYLLEKLECPRE